MLSEGAEFTLDATAADKALADILFGNGDGDAENFGGLADGGLPDDALEALLNLPGGPIDSARVTNDEDEGLPGLLLNQQDLHQTVLMSSDPFLFEQSSAAATGQPPTPGGDNRARRESRSSDEGIGLSPNPNVPRSRTAASGTSEVMTLGQRQAAIQQLPGYYYC